MIRNLLTHNNGLRMWHMKESYLPYYRKSKALPDRSGKKSYLQAPAPSSLVVTNSPSPQHNRGDHMAKQTCQPVCFHETKYHHHDIHRRKGWRESLPWISFQTSGTTQNDPHNSTQGRKSAKMWASRKLQIILSLRLRLYTVMLWYCLVSSSVSHFAQLLSDKTGSRHSLFCMHSSSLKNIFIQLLR